MREKADGFMGESGSEERQVPDRQPVWEQGPFLGSRATGIRPRRREGRGQEGAWPARDKRRSFQTSQGSGGAGRGVDVTRGTGHPSSLSVFEDGTTNHAPVFSAGLEDSLGIIS